MKILVLFTHPWRGGRAGGAETHATQLIQALALRGHEVVFVASTGKTPDDAPCPGAIAQYRLPFQSLNPFDKLRAYRLLADIVRRHGIQLVHAHHRTGGYFAEFLFRRTGIPCVVTVHDIWHRAPFKSLHGRIFHRLIAVSAFIQQGLVQHFGIAPAAVTVIHNGIDPARLTPATSSEVAAFRRRFGIGQHVVFSLVARITRAKGHYDLIHALRLLPPRLACKCLIVGEGRDREKLHQLAIQHGVADKVVFCGYQANISLVMQASDVILLPSHHEPFGLALVEAMFFARAVLASNAGGIPEIVTHQHDGLLVPPGDLPALAQAIQLLATDEPLRHRLGEQGQRTAHDRFLLSTMVDRTETLYAEIVHSASARNSGLGTA